MINFLSYSNYQSLKEKLFKHIRLRSFNLQFLMFYHFIQHRQPTEHDHTHEDPTEDTVLKVEEAHVSKTEYL